MAMDEHPARAPDKSPAEAGGGPSLLALETRAFRNLADGRLRLPAEARLRILVGPNGAGKTSLMEAISMLAPGRGMRGARLGEILRAGADPGRGWTVAAALVDAYGGERRAVVHALPAATGEEAEEGDDDDAPGDAAPAGGPVRLRRQVILDGRQTIPAALSSLATIAWATPAMDRLFVESAGGRRRFFDRMVASFFPEHARLLARHERAMRQRLRLLAERGPAADPHWLAALEAQLAETGAAIAAARVETAALLNAHARQLAPEDFPVPRVAFAGEAEELIAAGTPALKLEERLRERLRARRRADAEERRTGAGVHLSDVVVHGIFPPARAERPARLASTGEQKVLLLALVLVHAELAALHSGAPVILLLDEVAAHLDARRRAALFARIAALRGEVWLSGTDRTLFGALARRGDCVLLRIDEGRIGH
ncbi:MAG: DNA replication and repair protein RecF [Rhodothalassiaceae bacterium]|nr:MAG: DNA replication and repair protein RecF [Rhodothalassiaceae bacterium]